MRRPSCVFKGNPKSVDKIVSVFEPDTKILRRGKVHKPTEFGKMVKVQEAEGGVVTDIAVVSEHDAKLLVPSVEHHRRVFKRPPRVLATDRGFFSIENVRTAEAMGVACVAIPKLSAGAAHVPQDPPHLSSPQARPLHSGTHGEGCAGDEGEAASGPGNVPGGTDDASSDEQATARRPLIASQASALTITHVPRVFILEAHRGRPRRRGARAAPR